MLGGGPREDPVPSMAGTPTVYVPVLVEHAPSVIAAARHRLIAILMRPQVSFIASLFLICLVRYGPALPGYFRLITSHGDFHPVGCLVLKPPASTNR